MARFHEPTIREQRTFGSLCWMHLHAPELAGSVRAGHYLLVRCTATASADPLLRRPLFVAKSDPATGSVTLLFQPHERGLVWLAQQQPGMTLDLIGPFGTPFQLAPASGNLLLAGAGPDLGALLLLANEATKRNLAVMLFIAAPRADLLVPPFLLPPDVEYQTSIGAADTLLPLLAGTSAPAASATPKQPQPAAFALTTPLTWADQLCVALPDPLLTPLANAIRHVRLRWERGFAQALLDGPLPCGTGACRACLVTTRSGIRTRCKDGPVFDLREVGG